MTMPHPFTVLIADDTPLIRLLYARFVTESAPQLLPPEFAPLKILEAENGMEAAAALRSHRIDLVFLDLLMPIKNGLTLLSEIRSDDTLRDVSVVVCSGQDDVATRETAERNGADGFLTKPFTRAIIEKQMALVIARNSGAHC